ncbi:MAG: succinate dehydrogenase iron-sulfur subunit [Anaerolineaceae bacterium]|nr:succinate dehydrogenase iron-sulfur subunit [Anaerolineaceae bacterium]
MQIVVKVFRSNPAEDSQPRFDSFCLDVDPNDRVLDALERARDEADASLAYRRSCAHAVCGSCAMRIYGRNALACKVLIKDVWKKEITLEPLLGLRVIRDLVVDMEPFFDHYYSVMPFLINTEPLPEDKKERLQTPQERERFDDTTKCILCGACTTACPSFWINEGYLGPAAIVGAHRFIYDSRDFGAGERLAILNEQNGIWRCRTAFNFTEACPRNIKITRAIAEIKRTIQTKRLY